MTFQTLELDWLVFSAVLADALLFGICYALLVRWLYVKKVEDQTVWLVVFGVGSILVISIAFFGLLIVALFFALFAAAGLPMTIEYVGRIHLMRLRDAEEARRLLDREAVQDADASTDR